MTTNLNRIEKTAQHLIDGGYCIEGCQVREWVNNLSHQDRVRIDNLHPATVYKFNLCLNLCVVGPDQLTVRTRINQLTESLIAHA